MANCNDLFRLYNTAIRLSEDKRGILKTVRNSLREKMQTGFAAIPTAEINNHRLSFQTQESYVMDTIIAPSGQEGFDLDDGVYFIGNLHKNLRPATEKFHKWVLRVVGHDENYAEVTDKDTCVRVDYKKEKFHIDLPIYYSQNPAVPELAHKKKGWTDSGPIEFIYWFESKIKSGFEKSYLLEEAMKPTYQKWAADIRKTDAQLRRIVRYLKGWGAFLAGEMPPGIVMTILAAENYVANERDDIALRDTIVKIKSYLANNNCKCPRPTTPAGEDLFAEYSETKKQYFIDRLDTFVNSANQAIAAATQKDACLKWQKHFGPRFSCATASDTVEGAKHYAAPAIIGDNAKSAG